MIRVFLVFLLFAGNANAYLTDVQPGLLKGSHKINQELSSRVFQGDFDMVAYLNNDRNLRELLGAYKKGEKFYRFINGDPNSLNLFLYYLAFDQLSKDIGKVCTGGKMLQEKVSFRPPVRLLIETVCKWPKREARSEIILRSIWYYFMGFEAPESELQAWLSFIKEEYESSSREEAFSGIFMSLFLNPFFLLEG